VSWKQPLVPMTAGKANVIGRHKNTPPVDLLFSFHFLRLSLRGDS
jgi:hypothetical protein